MRLNIVFNLKRLFQFQHKKMDIFCDVSPSLLLEVVKLSFNFLESFYILR